MAAIYDTETGDTITAGLQGCIKCDEAIQMAEEIADDRDEDVWLEDDDGDWIVHPMRDGKREPADPFTPETSGEEERE
jgi:hypothetical protein